MRIIRSGMLAIALSFALASAAFAEVKVQLSDVHICCGACVKGIQKAVDGLGATVDIDRDGGSVKITAANEAAAQKVVDAITAAGYHGASDNDKVKVKDESGAAGGAVKRLKVGGVHNCCGGCANAIRDAIKGVPGVKGDDLKSKATEFVVEGDFNAAEVIKALYAAGFHAKPVN